MAGKRKMSVSRFAYRLSTLCAEIEVLEGRAAAGGLADVSERLREAKQAAMKANDAAYWHASKDQS